MTSETGPFVRYRVTDMKLLSTLSFFVLFNAASCGDLRPDHQLGAEAPSPVEQPVEPIEVFFSPKGGCTEAVVAMIGRAKRTVRLQAYSFTSPQIIEALVLARKKRGVDVQAILDRSDFETEGQEALTSAGIPVFIDKKHPIAHNKVLTVDSRETETGSFNYTKQAEHNAENCNVIRHLKSVRKYETNWEEHRAHSVPVGEYVRAEPRQSAAP